MTVCMKEFALNNYDNASISRIVETLGIAKGSVYQYFDDKFDLWMYLKEEAENTKASYVKELNRANYPDFWSYFRAQFRNGINFDLEHPVCSLFLYRMNTQENSATVKPYLDSWKEKARVMFREWVKQEKKAGSFSKKTDTDLIVHFLITMSLSIADLLRNKYHIDFEANIRNGKPLFADNLKELMKGVDELIALMQKALQ